MKKSKKEVLPVSEYEHGRGKIKDNALKAIVTSPLFTTRVMKAKKGKGSFARKEKYKGFCDLCLYFLVNRTKNNRSTH